MTGAARAAGDPGEIMPTTGASNRTPIMKAITNMTTAVIRFMTTPALTTIIRRPTGVLP